MYALSLLDALHRLGPAADMMVLVRQEVYGALRTLHPDWLIQGVAVSSTLLWHAFTLPRLLASVRPAALHLLGETAITSVPVPYVMSVHEVPPAVRRAVARPQRSVYEGMARCAQGALLPRACRRAGRVLALSESTARDLQREYGVSEDRISVAYPAAGPRFGVAARDAAGVSSVALPAPYVLTFATGDAREEPEDVVQAFGAVCRHVPHALVIAGRCPALVRARLTALANEVGCAGRLHFAGYVPDGDLPHIYGAADVFVEVTRYEGFGLQLCEAMASGTPVIGVDTSSVPEVVGSGGHLVPLHDTAALARVLASLLTDANARDRWSQRARQQAARFSWDTCAAIAWDALTHVMEPAKGHPVNA